MADYTSYFGYGFSAKGLIETADVTNYDIQAKSTTLEKDVLTTTNDYYVIGTSLAPVVSASADTLTAAPALPVKVIPQFNLYASMQLFFANGGGNCFVISVKNYWGEQSVTPKFGTDPVPVNKDDLIEGLKVSKVTRGGTMLVVPEACLLTTLIGGLYTEYQPVVVEMLEQSAALQDRVAIIDMPGALESSNWTATAMTAEANAFYTTINTAADAFSYGAAYGPALESSLLSASDLLYDNLWGASDTTDSITLMNNLLTSQALALYPSVVTTTTTVDTKDSTKTSTTTTTTYSVKFQNVAAHIAAAFPVADITSNGVPTNIAGVITTTPRLLSMLTTTTPSPASTDAPAMKALDQYLTNAVPLLGQVQQILANQLNVVPPSGVMAGVWTKNDANRGVWNAPANVSLNEIIAPKVVLTDEEQGDFNVPLNGNAIDILRAMVNRGTVVWGARTLDGNSLDYRYIQVRRTLIYIEQSIKTALQQFVFAANDGGTWATVTATISNFLTQFWQAGGLMGDKASDAFTVACGVPTTMSGLDVLNGYMIVNVTVQLIHPAEFIELTFSQTMQGT
ncbi:phage tail sheath family protein [Glaciimonas sp. GG7]